MSTSQKIYASDSFYASMQDSILANRPDIDPEAIVDLYLDGFVGKEIIEILDAA